MGNAYNTSSLMNNYFVLLILATFFLGCENAQENESDYFIRSIDIPENEKQMNASDLISDMKLIKLEQTNESIVGEIVKIEFFDGNIFIQDANFQGLYVFDDQGSFQKVFNRLGNGPGEYSTLSDFEVDPQNQTLEIFDKETNEILLFDSEEFHFKESFPLPVQSVFRFVKYMDDYYFQTNGTQNKIADDYTYSDIIYFNRKTGKIIPLIERQTPTSNQFLEFSNIFYTNDENDIFVSLAWDQTIHRIRENRIYPAIIVDPGDRAIPKTILEGPPEDKLAFILSDAGKHKIGGFRLLHWDGNNFIMAYGMGSSGKQHFYFSLQDGSESFAASSIVNDMDMIQLPDIEIARIVDDEIISVIYPYSLENKEQLDFFDVSENGNPILAIYKFKLDI